MFAIIRAWTPGLAVILAVAGAVAHAKPAVPTVAQLAAYSNMSSFTLSPDGTHKAGL